jgi:DNA invertase Pin-like site-specific DNA recombinase
MAAFAELEREMIVEKVVGGVRKAQAAGKHCGRSRRIFRRDEAATLREEGKSSPAIGRILGVARRNRQGTVAETLHRTVDGNQGNGRHVGGWRHHCGNRQLSAMPGR